MLKVAINGFGRVGRSAFKIAVEKFLSELGIVAINDLGDAKTLAHLLKYDTVYGPYPREISSDEKSILVEGKSYPVFAETDPAKLPWASLGVDVVIESTGRFRTKEAAMAHVTAGAKRVIISAPAKGEGVPTLVLGVNAQTDDGSPVINNASCTTNCIAPVMQVLEEKLGILKAMMSTVHGYTADQNLQDGPHKDLRRARAAALNIIPASTGAATATAEVIPALKGIFDGMAYRVPVATGSVSDFVVLVKRRTTEDEVRQIFRDAARDTKYAGILTVTEEPIVSSDIIGREESSIVDLALTKVVSGDLVKVVAWYDNEWGYSNRLVEMCIVAGKKILK